MVLCSLDKVPSPAKARPPPALPHLERKRKVVKVCDLVVEEGCPYYQPSVQNVRLRTFFAVTRERYDWQYSFETDFSFTGGVVPFLKALYLKRSKDFQVGCRITKYALLLLCDCYLH